MQAASSSRARKSRTQRESSDAIEDGGSSRKATQDEVMEDDERPRPKGKGKGKAKVKSERGQVPTVNEEDILGDIADQPLDRQQMQKLQGLAQDWSTTRQGIHVTSFNLAIDVASALAEFGEGDDAEKVDEVLLSRAET